MSLKPKNILKLLYACSVIIVLTLVGLFLAERWTSQIEEVQKTLVERAREVNARINYQLLDASRLLDVAKSRIESRILAGNLSQTAAHKALDESIDFFNLNVHKHNLGILFYADKTGHIDAENGNPRQSRVDINDRAYFKNAKNNLGERWAVGDRVIGRTTAIPMFHLATALYDAKSRFQGIVFVQLRESEFDDLKLFRAEDYPICFLVFQQNGLVSARIPAEEPCFSSKNEDKLYRLANSKPSLHMDSFELVTEVSGNGESYQAGYDRSAVFKTTVVAALPVAFIFWQQFLPSVIPVVLIALLGFLVVSLLFYRLYVYLDRFENAQHASMTDELTSMCNRRSLDIEFPALWKNAIRNKAPVSVLFVDIDHFKAVNDSYGHEMGDVVLKAVADVIRRSLNRPLDLVCRWGGEEFVVVLPDTDKDGAVHVTERIMEEVRKKSIFFPEDILKTGKHVGVTVSIGVASMVVTLADMTEDLIDRADKAMLQAKAAGRDCYRIWQRAIV